MTPRPKKLGVATRRELEKALESSMSEGQKRAFLESLEEAERDIREGRYVVFDPQTTFIDLKNKTISRRNKK